LYRVFRRYASFKMAKFKDLAFHFRFISGIAMRPTRAGCHGKLIASRQHDRRTSHSF
jgi:hypothetical protein